MNSFDATQISADVSREWLETDSLGGFASGTVSGIRTRRYHALLLYAKTPPSERFVLVNGMDVWIATGAGRFDLSSQWYSPGVLGGSGAQCIESFASSPWPTWIYRFADGTRIAQEIFMTEGVPVTYIGWKLLAPACLVKLTVRPFLSGREYHALHHVNPAFNFAATLAPGSVSWKPYLDVSGVTASGNGTYFHDPHWYLKFLYQEEQARGLDCEEDLASPGTFSWALDAAPAHLIFAAEEHACGPKSERLGDGPALERALEARRRANVGSCLQAAARRYIVSRRSNAADQGKTIIAGYPWFTDWGRDTFIAMRGLCITTGRLTTARDILLAWASSVSQGMVPNRFPDQGETPQYNSVDASLWFINAVREYMDACGKTAADVASQSPLHAAVNQILDGYSRGTRFGIRLDHDGLLAAGEPGSQLTWMDAKVGDWVVTPRIGKPVEVQALWLNALAYAGETDSRWREPLERGMHAFGERYWNSERRCLYDVVDADHQPGHDDATLRPNQIFAVGGLPLALLGGARARQVVDTVQEQLWTPMGLRSLAPGEPGYQAHYMGNARQRDGSYHQGTVWPWLMGAFVDAWLRAHGNDADSRRQAKDQFLAPLLASMSEAGLGHISEIADADSPHTPRGCPFQAWSMGEVIRIEHLLADV